MITFRNGLCVAAALWLGVLTGCTARKSPPVAAATRKALDQAGLKNVSVKQDRENGVVFLAGQAPNDAAKAQADAIAQGIAVGQVVANEIAVVPPNSGSQTRTLYADLDKGIQSNLDAALIRNGVPGAIHHRSENGVVLLTGTVSSEQARNQAQQVAVGVPNVQQVVNELQIQHQKATATQWQ
ncbi:MAG TPA: BON domain-containing protein [Bryobacteraceae bacterium]|nr:BON domain-containing protein [Bryobacteraceae bacterium]